VQSSIDQQQQQQMQSNIVCLPITTNQHNKKTILFSQLPYFNERQQHTIFVYDETKTLPMCFQQNINKMCVCHVFLIQSVTTD